MLKLADIPKVELKRRSKRHVFEGVSAGRKYQESKKPTEIEILLEDKIAPGKRKIQKMKELPSRGGKF